VTAVVTTKAAAAAVKAERKAKRRQRREQLGEMLITRLQGAASATELLSAVVLFESAVPHMLWHELTPVCIAIALLLVWEGRETAILLHCLCLQQQQQEEQEGEEGEEERVCLWARKKREK
jgi:hypothetical protein